MHVHVDKNAGVNCRLQSIWLCRCLRKSITEAHVAANMCKVLNGTGQGLLPEHLNHMNRFSLFWEMSASSCGHQVIGISADVDGDLGPADVRPKASKHLTGAKAFHQGIQL